MRGMSYRDFIWLDAKRDPLYLEESSDISTIRRKWEDVAFLLDDLHYELGRLIQRELNEYHPTE